MKLSIIWELKKKKTTWKVALLPKVLHVEKLWEAVAE